VLEQLTPVDTSRVTRARKQQRGLKIAAETKEKVGSGEKISGRMKV